MKTFFHNAQSPYDVAYVDQAEFSAGEAYAITGVNQKLQVKWRDRDLLVPIPGRGHARFLIDEVVRMTIMQRLSESGISFKRLRSLTMVAGHHVTAKLMAMPGAVAIKAESAEAEAQEVERIEAWAARSRERYLFIPLPEPDGWEARSPDYLRSDLSDLHELVDQNGLFHGLLIDLDAVARLVHSRVTLPLETHVVTLRRVETEGAE